ncbi:MAG: hypothetical protein CO133_00755, partial [Candidatus Komeilibacteria bacterium CG_4_9_14_3_um_filter_37_5]
AYLRAKIRTFPYRQNIKIVYQNFFQADFKEVNYIFTYLLPTAQEKVESRIMPKLKSGTLLITYAFCLPTIKSSQELDTVTDKKSGKIYLYKI